MSKQKSAPDPTPSIEGFSKIWRPPETVKQIEETTPIFSLAFEIKPYHETDAVGHDSNNAGYYVLCNGVVIYTLYPSPPDLDSRHGQSVQEQIKYIKEYLEADLLSAALGTCSLSEPFAHAKVFPHVKNLSVEFYKYLKKRLSDSDGKRRNRRAGVVPGNKSGSRRVKAEETVLRVQEVVRILLSKKINPKDIDPRLVDGALRLNRDDLLKLGRRRALELRKASDTYKAEAFRQRMRRQGIRDWRTFVLSCREDVNYMNN